MRKNMSKRGNLADMYKIEIDNEVAPPLDLHSPDPATPLSAAQDRWCSSESSLRQ